MTSALHEEIRKILERQGTSDPAFDSIACSVLGVFDAQAAVVYTLDAGTGMLKLRCHCGLPKEVSEKIRFLYLGKGLAGKTATLRQPVQAYHHPGSACAEELEVLPPGAVYVPMLVENSLRGVLGIAKAYHREYAPDEIEALSSIARLIAAYLK